MSAPKHTPGPWVIVSQAETSRYITVRAVHGRVVSRVPFNNQLRVNRGDPVTDIHDAHLIAGAPDLLAVLEHIRGFIEGRAHFDSRFPVLVAAAIARARGEI